MMLRRALLLLFAAGFALTARAACVEPGGMGGTGISSDGGIGGTGTRANTDGIGGTGVRADVDVGLVGVITGFGSVCVNGVEVAYDATTTIVTADAGQLAVGQVVAVRATQSAGLLRAQRIEILEAAVGPVSAFDRVTGLMQVAGHQVQIQRATVFAGVTRETLAEPGALRVSGLARTDGTLEATRIERAADDAAPHPARTRWPDLGTSRMIVQGYVEDVDTGHVAVAGLRFEVAPSVAGGLRRDELVRLRIAGQPDGRRVVERVDFLRSALDAGPERSIGREGRFDAGDLRPDRGERGERSDRSGPDHPDRPERVDRPDRGGGPGPDRPERLDRGGGGGGPGRH